MGVFSFANKVENDIVETRKKIGPFDHIRKIYDIIRTNDLLDDVDELLDEQFKELEDGDFYFISWALNHNLLYNKFTRKNVEMFTIVNTFLTPREYIYFYVKFMIQNKIKFPFFMAWYKASIYSEDKKYIENLKEQYDLDDEELATLIDYFREKDISIRELCINLNYIERTEE